MRNETPKLTDAELEIMHVVWELARSTNVSTNVAPSRTPQ